MGLSSEMIFFIPPSQRRIALLAAQADSAPVLIQGGPGSGKGAVARWIHENGPRVGRPFVEAKASRSLTTEISMAQGGTLLINEIGARGFSEQKVLSRFLKTKTLPEVSGLQMPTQIFNVRIIATTSQSLENRALGGLFNTELLEKLSVFQIQMPRLANRNPEFDDIAQAILDEVTRELHREFIRGFAPDALETLRNYDWPGNVRELRNVLKLAVVKCAGDSIAATDLPEFGYHRIDFRATREQFEKVYLQEVLKSFDYEIDRTCRIARMDRGVLMAKIEAYGIELERASIR